MNKKIIYGLPGGFPLTQDTLNFSQQATEFLEKIAEAFCSSQGSRFLFVEGVDVEGDIASPGIVICDGKIYPFAGGIVQEYVYVKEEMQSAVFLDGTENEVYVSREVHFGKPEGAVSYLWSDFIPITQGISASGRYPDLIAGDSLKLGGALASQYARIKGTYQNMTAGDAQKLGGTAADQYAKINGDYQNMKVGDSAKLGGIAADQYALLDTPAGWKRFQENGYWQSSDGLLIQWGVCSVRDECYFPKSFNVVFSIALTARSAITSSTFQLSIIEMTESSFSIKSDHTVSQCYWLAIGTWK